MPNLKERFEELKQNARPLSVMFANDHDVWTPFRLYDSDLRRYCAVVSLASFNHLVMFAGEKGWARFEEKMLDYSTGDHVVSITDLTTGEPVSFELKLAMVLP